MFRLLRRAAPLRDRRQPAGPPAGAEQNHHVRLGSGGVFFCYPSKRNDDICPEIKLFRNWSISLERSLQTPAMLSNANSNSLPPQTRPQACLSGASSRGGARRGSGLGRRKIGQSFLHRRNFIGGFYGATEIFLRPRKTPV